MVDETQALNARDFIRGLCVLAVMAAFLIAFGVLSYRRFWAPVDYSEPFVVSRVEYVPGGFGSAEKTVLMMADGATIVIPEHVSIPDGKLVMVTRNGHYVRLERSETIREKSLD